MSTTANPAPFDGPAAHRFLDVQVAAEGHALRLLARADVNAARVALAATWREGTPGFLPETYGQVEPSIREVALLVALQVVNGDARRPEVVEISASPHRWGGLEVPGGRWGINNPDTLYFQIPIEAGSRYVIHGQRAPQGPIDINVSVQVPDVWATLDNLGQRDLAVDAQGRYRITIDDLPADGRRHHLQHRPGGSTLIVRQTLADWTRSRPDVLTVERTAGPEAAAPRSDDELARQLIARLADVIQHNIHTLQAPIFRNPVNTIPQPGGRGDKSGYLVTQRNTLGHFRLSDDEALVAVMTPGGAGYAAFTATNIWGISPEPSHHQNSLNTHQAERDADGNITLVVANRDPGVSNWIDPGGLREGILMLRWQLLDDAPSSASGGPAITLRAVRIEALGTVLPRTVPRLGAQERERQLRERREAFASRFLNR